MPHISSLKNSISEFKNPNLLDLCCGDGVYSFIGAINGANVIALDYSEKSIEVEFNQFKPFDYAQLNTPEFLPGLSVIDILMNLGPEQTALQLKNQLH